VSAAVRQRPGPFVDPVEELDSGTEGDPKLPFLAPDSEAPAPWCTLPDVSSGAAVLPVVSGLVVLPVEPETLPEPYELEPEVLPDPYAPVEPDELDEPRSWPALTFTATSFPSTSLKLARTSWPSLRSVRFASCPSTWNMVCGTIVSDFFWPESDWITSSRRETFAILPLTTVSSACALAASPIAKSGSRATSDEDAVPPAELPELEPTDELELPIDELEVVSGELGAVVSCGSRGSLVVWLLSGRPLEAVAPAPVDAPEGEFATVFSWAVLGSEVVWFWSTWPPCAVAAAPGAVFGCAVLGSGVGAVAVSVGWLAPLLAVALSALFCERVWVQAIPRTSGSASASPRTCMYDSSLVTSKLGARRAARDPLRKARAAGRSRRYAPRRMLVRALALILLLASSGCRRDVGPAERYSAFAAAARDGDAEAVWSMLSAGTREALDARARALAVRVPAGVVSASGRQLVLGDLAPRARRPRSVVVVRESRDAAVVAVEVEGESAREASLVREGGAWRVVVPFGN
jgi:hypothetical protein